MILIFIMIYISIPINNPISMKTIIIIISSIIIIVIIVILISLAIIDLYSHVTLTSIGESETNKITTKNKTTKSRHRVVSV